MVWEQGFLGLEIQVLAFQDLMRKGSGFRVLGFRV